MSLDLSILVRQEPTLPFRMHDRPRRRSDCEGGPRPCPWVSCRYHLLFEIGPRLVESHRRTQWAPSVMERISVGEYVSILSEMKHTCVLDLVDENGPMTLEQIGEIWNVTRERIRQIQDKALDRLEAKTRKLGIQKDVRELLQEVGTFSFRRKA